MNGLILIGLFFTEFLLLFFISKSVINAMFSLFYFLTRSKKLTINILAMIFLPGTIIHELAHLLTAGMMGVHVGEIDVLPSVRDDGVRLGMVEIGQTDILRRSVIGIAPIIIGLCIIFVVFWLLQAGSLVFTAFWQQAVVIYLIFGITNTMFSSKKDLEEVIAFFIAIFLVLIICFIGLLFAGYISFLSSIEILNSRWIVDFFQKLDLLLSILIGIDFLVLGLTKLLNLKTT